MGDLTNAQKKVLKVLIENQKAGNLPLTVQAIGDRVGYRSKASTHNALIALEGKGYIEREYNTPKSYKVIKGITYTYGDKIRRMKDEEISLIMSEFSCPGIIFHGGPVALNCDRTECNECWTDFLGQEVADETVSQCHTG